MPYSCTKWCGKSWFCSYQFSRYSRTALRKKCPYFGVILVRIQSECMKIWTRITLNMGTFHTVLNSALDFGTVFPPCSLHGATCSRNLRVRNFTRVRRVYPCDHMSHMTKPELVIYIFFFFTCFSCVCSVFSLRVKFNIDRSFSEMWRRYWIKFKIDK